MEHTGLPGLKTRWLGQNLIVLDQVDSTNTWLKQNGSRLPNGTVVLARQQTDGRGRLGRQWFDEPEAGLAMSVLLQHPWSALSGGIPLIAGLCVCEALSELSDSRLFSIKWSNDVLWNERKICGILCESRTMGKNSFSVIGIGVNLLHNHSTLLQHGLVYATSLFLATQKKYTPDEIAGHICGKLEYYLDLCLENGIDSVLVQYRRHCINIGRQIRISGEHDVIEGTALDIADDGALICRTDIGEIIHIHAGEATIRGMDGYV